MKTIVVYFTHSNNTGLAAKKLVDLTGLESVRVQPKEPYSTADLDWTNEQSRCTQEHLNQTLCPAIKPIDVDFSKYDTVFIGYLIRWHEEPAVIRTILDNYGNQLKGKQLYPFCTSHESSMSEADATLQKGLPELNWHKGLRFPTSDNVVRNWIAE